MASPIKQLQRGQVILVFAANQIVFQEWMRRNQLRPGMRAVQYVTKSDQLRGCMDPLVLLLPGYQDNHIWTAQLHGMLKHRNGDGEIKYVDPDQAAQLLGSAVQNAQHQGG